MTARSLLALAALASLAACRTAPASPRAEDAAVLASWMTGTYSSAAQAADDPENFFHVRLVTTPIWTDRTDGHWLYVEQAVAAALERPYRQRVYRVHGTESGVRSDVYELPGDPLDFVAAWERPELFDAIEPGDLALREGCSIHLVRAGANEFTGSTRGEGCSSSLGDAAFATSEVRVTPNVLTSWDRGFTADGEQAWGATEGPYVFVRE